MTYVSHPWLLYTTQRSYHTHGSDTRHDKRITPTNATHHTMNVSQPWTFYTTWQAYHTHGSFTTYDNSITPTDPTHHTMKVSRPRIRYTTKQKCHTDEFYTPHHHTTHPAADPGFPQGRCQPQRGPLTYYLASFWPKTAWKWKKMDSGVYPVPHRSSTNNRRWWKIHFPREKDRFSSW